MLSDLCQLLCWILYQCYSEGYIRLDSQAVGYTGLCQVAIAVRWLCRHMCMVATNKAPVGKEKEIRRQNLK